VCPYGTVHITCVQSSGRESPLEPAALVLLLLNWCEWKSSFDFGASGNCHLILDIGGLPGTIGFADLSARLSLLCRLGLGLDGCHLLGCRFGCLLRLLSWISDGRRLPHDLSFAALHLLFCVAREAHILLSIDQPALSLTVGAALVARDGCRGFHLTRHGGGGNGSGLWGFGV